MSSSCSTSSSIEDIANDLYCGIGLGPMVRASTTPLRTLALQYGADFVYTEELIDRSLTSTTRIVNHELNTIDYIKDSNRLSNKQLRKISKDDEERASVLLRIDRTVEKGKLICQIGTGDPQSALKAALHVHQDVDAIDINMGCPKKFSISGGMGSSLLTDPERACNIIRTLSETMKPLGKPISAKIRLLQNVQSTIDFATALIEAGVNAIAIHGRKVGDPEVRAADWETLEDVVSLLKRKYPHIPILFNGDFYTRHEFINFQMKTKANGVLLARPALYNTSIFRKPDSPDPDNNPNKNSTINKKQENNNEIIDDPTIVNRSKICYHYDSVLLLDKTRVVQDYLREAIKYNIHYKNVKYVICEMMNSRRAPVDRTKVLVQHYPGGQTIGTTCTCSSLMELSLLWNLEDKKNPTPHLPHDNLNTPVLLAGEHLYSDSYFLEKTSIPATASSVVIRDVDLGSTSGSRRIKNSSSTSGSTSSISDRSDKRIRTE